MLVEIRVPELGNEAREAILVAWHRQPGDAVAKDEPIADVMTDKVNLEIVSPAAGTIKEVLVAQDETVSVGRVIATLAVAS